MSSTFLLVRTLASNDIIDMIDIFADVEVGAEVFVRVGQSVESALSALSAICSAFSAKFNNF